MRILRCHGLVTKIEGDPVFTRLADHTGQQDCGWQEWQVGESIAIAKVPQHRRARTANAVRLRRVNAKGGRAAGDELLHDHTFSF